MIKKALKYLLSFSLAVLFFWLAFKDFTVADFERLLKTISGVNLNLIIAVIVAIVISNVIRAWRWSLLLSTVKERMNLLNLYNSTMIGYAVNMVLPRVGEISKAVNLSKYENIDVKKVLASVVIERILDTLVFAMLLAISSFAFRHKINEVFGNIDFLGVQMPLEMMSYLMLLMTVMLLVLFAALSLYPEKVAEIIESGFSKISEKLAARASEFVKAFIEGAGALKQPTKYLEIIISSFVIWFIYLLGTLLPMYAMNYDAKYGLGFMEAMATMSISAFGQFVTPAGAGTYQYICQTILSDLFDVLLPEASAFALLTFAISFFTSGLFGLLSIVWQSYFVLRYESNEKNNVEKHDQTTANNSIV